MAVTTVEIDLAQQVFHLYGEDARGKAVLCKRLSRATLKPFLATLLPCRIMLQQINRVRRGLPTLMVENAKSLKRL